MKKLRKRVFLFLVVFFTGLLVACSDETSENGDANDENEAGDTVIRMSWWGNQPRHDYTIELIKLFEEKNPNITIDYEYAGWDDYWRKLAPQAAANELPDIIQMDVAYITEYAEKNQITDLSPFLENDIDTSDISENFILGGQINDGIYGFPTGSNVLAFMYDPNMLEKIGLDAIPEDWTWDDYIELSDKAVEAGMTFDVGIGGNIHFDYYLRTHGERLFAEDGKGLGYTDDQLYVDYYSMLQGRVEAEATPTPDYMNQLAGQEEFPVVKGEGVGKFNWSSVSYGLEENLGSAIKLAPMPGPNTSDGLFLKPTMYFSIAENSENKEAAAKFIDFYTNDPEANEIILGERGVPGSAKVLEALKSDLTGIRKENFEYVEWAEDNSSPMGAIEPSGTGQVIDLLGDLYDGIMYGEITPEEAAENFRIEAESILE